MAKVGVIVARFQGSELHAGHRFLIDTALGENDRIIIFLGCTRGHRSKLNPLDFTTRRLMIGATYPVHADRIDVAPIFDTKRDWEWSVNLDAEISKYKTDFDNVTLYYSRDSFKDHYVGKYLLATKYVLPMDGLSSTDNRNTCSDEVLSSRDFRHGVIYGRMNTYNKPDATVDIVPLIKDEHDDIWYLLGRKPSEDEWRFVGGYVEANDADYETAAKRECREESGTYPQQLFYIGSSRIDDWRYKLSQDSIITTFFGGWVTDFSSHAGDDLEEVKWFRLKNGIHPSIVDTHKLLFDMFLNYMAKE